MSSVVEQFSQELAAMAERAGKAVVTVRARHRIPSSGIHWRHGVVVTADHTVKRGDNISVLAEGGKRLGAQLVGRDPGTDVAVLKLEDSEGLATPEFGDSTNAKLAEIVLALGRTRSGSVVASSGIIGGVTGDGQTWRGGRLDQNIRLDLNLYPGFSGGPLLNASGKVVAMNTSGLGRGRAMAVPVSTVNRSVDQLLEKGYIPRPYLGIAMQPVSLPEELRTKAGASRDGGLMVLHVEPSGPAARAGILLGDVIVELKGGAAIELDSLYHLAASLKIGESVEAQVLRAGMPVKVTLTVGERPPE